MWIPLRPVMVLAVITAAFSLGSPGLATTDSGSFRDDDTSRFEAFIEAASAAGLVRGCNPPQNDLFCPNDVVTRGEMAMMLVRAIDLPEGKPRFDDVVGHPAEDAIGRLAEAAITSGCESARFCPDDPLTRGQLAALLERAFGHEIPPAAYNHYRDLDTTEFASALALLGMRGILEACDPPVGRRICPDLAVTRGEAAYSLVSALGLAPVSPTGRLAALETTPALAEAFDIVGIWNSRKPSTRNRVAVTSSGFRDEGLRVTIPKGSHYGADFRLGLSSVVGHDPEQLFFRYYLRFDPDWAPTASGKLPGFSGMYGRAGKGGHRSSPSSPGWSARMQFFGTRPGDPRARMGFYVYHLGQERRYGDGMMWNEAGKLRLDEWYCVEGEVQLNTPGMADGALRGWVDGTPAFDTTGIQFRRPDEPGIRIESFWFNVYYGGKPVAPATMGLTVDGLAVDTARIGCGAGDGLGGSIEADVTGDGVPGRLWWGDCPGGTCFQLARTATEGVEDTMRLGDTAWFSLETHHLGIHAADLTGNERDDVIYRGRCARSAPCWRVHRSTGTSLGPGEDWGDGLRLNQDTDTLTTGDFDGDGLDDVAYRGRCGTPSEVCWRVHRSLGNGLAEPEHWGPPGDEAATLVQAADITGNGRMDLVYAAACGGDELCWFAQTSTGSSFKAPRRLGTARHPELEFARLFDIDDDGRADLVTARDTAEGTMVIEYRPMTDRGWGRLTPLTEGTGPFEDLLLRAPRGGSPARAMVVTGCEERTMCVDTFDITSGVVHHPADWRGRSQAIRSGLLPHRVE